VLVPGESTAVSRLSVDWLRKARAMDVKKLVGAGAAAEPAPGRGLETGRGFGAGAGAGTGTAAAGAAAGAGAGAGARRARVGWHVLSSCAASTAAASGLSKVILDVPVAWSAAAWWVGRVGGVRKAARRRGVESVILGLGRDWIGPTPGPQYGLNRG